MEPVPEPIVEKTWQEAAGFSPSRAKKEMIKIGNRQPDLLAFVMQSSQDMGQKVRELAIYMFVLIYRMLQKAQPKKCLIVLHPPFLKSSIAVWAWFMQCFIRKA